MANTPRLNDDLIPALAKHVNEGGLLMVFPGDAIDSRWFNERLAKVALEDGNQKVFMPMLFAEQPSIVEQDQTGMKLRQEVFEHPATQMLNDTRWGGLDTLETRGWYQLIRNEVQPRTQAHFLERTVPGALVSKSDSFRGKRDIGHRFISALNANEEISSSETLVLLSMSNGDPWMVERPFGKGTIIQYATTCDDRWTNWPMRPFFLPMIHQAMLSSTPIQQWPVNVQTGQILTSPNQTILEWIEDGSRTKNSSNQLNRQVQNTDTGRSQNRLLQWKIPGKSSDNSGGSGKEPARELVDQIAESDSQTPTTGVPSITARFPGNYTILGLGADPVYLSAQLPIEESELAQATSDQLDKVAEALDAKIVYSALEFQQLQTGSGRELWKLFLIGLLVCLFGEVFIQRYLSRGAA